MYLAVRRSHHALLALSFFIAMVLTVFSTLLCVPCHSTQFGPFSLNTLLRYFSERGTWDDNLETFINSDGDATQFQVRTTPLSCLPIYI
jgi:hypothetical protein